MTRRAWGLGAASLLVLALAALAYFVAARKVRVPVLLIHGEADVDTPPDHSRRVFTALSGQKRLIIVPGARHNESLRGDVWNEIESWVDMMLAATAVP